MKTDALLLHLARLSGQPLLLRGDHLVARLALGSDLLKRKALDDHDDRDGDAGRPAYVPPWESRETITLHPGGVAVIPIHGMLAKGLDKLTAWCLDMWRVEAVEAAINTVSARADITTVIFDINSPGGYTTGIPELGAMVAALTEQKSTYAYTAVLCCSAAYWIASQCGAIFCAGSSDVGSVGTYCALYDYTEYLAKHGIKLELFKAGRMKAIGLMGKPLTDEEKEFMQADVDRLNEKFLAAVKAGRPPLADDDLQGQWFDGESAVAKRLADAIVPSLHALLQSLATFRV